ncbi:TolC family protein [Veillonella agrestimuris]|uniref:TolC family protein n=1 Tax=Veillonella agrestimuris TaxID=2941340 RepID=UPI0020417BB1|nr:TolC family protein [Veillonella agrestimuris]
MNKKALTLAIILSMATTGAFAADVVSTSINNSDKLSKHQKEAIMLTQKQLAEKAAQDAQTFDRTITLNEGATINLALANNRTAKQSMWDYEAAKANVSVAASAKNPSLTYGWSGTRTHVDSGSSSNAAIAAAGGGTGSSTSKSGTHALTLSVPVFSPADDANIRGMRYSREGTGAAYEEALQQAKYDAVNGYYTLIMNRNLVDVANQSVKDYQGHVDNVRAQYNVGLVANSDVLAANTNLAESQTTLVQRQNTADLSEANLNNIIGYPVQTSINTVEQSLQYKPYNVTLEQSKAYAMLHRSALVQSAMAVKQAEQSVKQAKAGYLPTVSANVNRRHADNDGYFGSDNKSWAVGATATWALWNGGQTQNQIKVAEANLAKAKEANLAAVDSVNLAVQQAYLNLRSAEQTIASTQTAVEQGQENFRIATLRYRAGVGTNLDVLDAETTLTTARNNYVQALYNYNVSIAALEQATGVPLETPVGGGAAVIANSGAEAELAALTNGSN